jgi:hypothetical protein
MERDRGRCAGGHNVGAHGILCSCQVRSWWARGGVRRGQLLCTSCSKGALLSPILCFWLFMDILPHQWFALSKVELACNGCCCVQRACPSHAALTPKAAGVLPAPGAAAPAAGSLMAGPSQPGVVRGIVAWCVLVLRDMCCCWLATGAFSSGQEEERVGVCLGR